MDKKKVEKKVAPKRRARKPKAVKIEMPSNEKEVMVNGKKYIEVTEEGFTYLK